MKRCHTGQSLGRYAQFNEHMYRNTLEELYTSNDYISALFSSFSENHIILREPA